MVQEVFRRTLSDLGVEVEHNVFGCPDCQWEGRNVVYCPRSVEREVRLPDVSHYPATAYSGPMIRWRLLAAADVRRALFSSPSVDRPMCAKQHHT